MFLDIHEGYLRQGYHPIPRGVGGVQALARNRGTHVGTMTTYSIYSVIRRKYTV